MNIKMQFGIAVVSIFAIMPLDTDGQGFPFEDWLQNYSEQLIDFSNISKEFPDYLPLPLESMYRSRVLHMISYWRFSEQFPFGKQQRETVKSEGIKSVGLREYSVDGADDIVATNPISDTRITFNRDGSIATHSKFLPDGTRLSHVEFTRTANSLSLEFTTRAGSFTWKLARIEDGGLQVASTQPLWGEIKLDKHGRILVDFLKKGSGGRTFAYNKTGSLDSYTLTNKPVFEKYAVTWQDGIPVSLNRVETNSKLGAIKNSSFNLKTTSNTQTITQKNQHHSYSLTLDSNNRPTNYTNTSYFKNLPPRDNLVIQFVYSENGLEIQQTTPHFKTPRKAFEQRTYGKCNLKFTYAAYFYTDSYFPRLWDVANLPIGGEFDIRFRENGKFSRIVKSTAPPLKKSILKIFDTSYFD